MSKKSDNKIADGLTIVFFIGMFCVIGWIAFRAGFPDYTIAVPADKTFIDYISAFAGPLTGMIAIGIALYNNRHTRINLDKQMTSERFRYNNNLSKQMSRDSRVESRFQKQIDEQIKLDKRADDRQQAEWTRRDKEAVSERNVKRRSIRKSMISELKSCIHMIEGALKINEEKFQKEGYHVYPEGLKIKRPVIENIGADIVLLNADMIRVLVSWEALYVDAYASMINKAEMLKKCYDDSDKSIAKIHQKHLVENIKMYLRICKNYIDDLEKMD